MNSGKDKFVRSERISIDDAQPGMIVADDIKTDAGGIVLSADSIILRNNIDKLREQGIEYLFVVKKETPKEDNPLRGFKAVIVDDSLFFRHMMAKMLYYMGIYVCGDAENGEDGIKIALKFKPDLVIMDMHLPGIEGYDAIKKIKEKLPNVKFLAISTDKDRKTIVEAIRSGAGDYLVKPLKWDQIRPRIENLLLPPQNGA